MGATIRCPRIIQAYLEIARQRAALKGFETPEALIDYLAALGRDPAGNGAYLSLIEVWRRGSICHADVAGRVVWLGLWPLLNWLYSEQVKFWWGEENELTSEIGRCLATVLRGTNLTRVESVALTLVCDTKRDLRRRRQAELADDHREWSTVIPPWQAFMKTDPSNTSEPEWLADVDGALQNDLGPDFKLAVAAYESRCDFDLLGRMFGLTEEEIRRRLQRAWRRIRRRSKKNRIE
jgi:hypothetical protein